MTDYVVDYENGNVMMLSTGTISNSADLDITYTYDVMREGEMAAIQRGKDYAAYQTIEFAADRLATQISDEAVVFSRSQLGWDAFPEPLRWLRRKCVTRLTNTSSGVRWHPLTLPLTVVEPGPQTVTPLLNWLRPSVRLSWLFRPTSLPDAVLMSLTNADRLENYFIQTTGTLAANMRANSGLLGNGATGLLVKGLPVMPLPTCPIPRFWYLIANWFNIGFGVPSRCTLRDRMPPILAIGKASCGQAILH